MAKQNIEMKRTAEGCGYWQNNGAYQQEYKKLWDELVPAEGEAKTVNGEILRASGKLYHEFFNNGNMNACDREYFTNWNYDEEDWEPIISDYYQEFIDFIRDTCKQDHELRGLLERIEEIILASDGRANDPADEHTYDLMIDHVMHWVLTHEDEPIKK